jgi:hypothetical protein
MAVGSIFTVVVIRLLVAGLLVAQVDVEVITTVTVCPFVRVVVVKVLLFVPAAIPPTYH